MKFVKWQDSKIGKYIEFKISVYYQEGPGAINPPGAGRDSLSDDRPASIYNWIIYKRYSNFVDL